MNETQVAVRWTHIVLSGHKLTKALDKLQDEIIELRDYHIKAGNEEAAKSQDECLTRITNALDALRMY